MQLFSFSFLFFLVFRYYKDMQFKELYISVKIQHSISVYVSGIFPYCN